MEPRHPIRPNPAPAVSSGSSDGERVSVSEAIGLVALALLVCAGQLKTSTLLNWLPLDLTALTAGVVAASCLLQAFRGRLQLSGLWLPVALLAALLVSISHAPVSTYASTKSITLASVTAILLISPFAIARTRQAHSLFLSSLLVIASIAALEIWISPTRAGTYSDIVVFGESTTIGTARLLGAGVLVAAVRALDRNIRTRDRVLLLALSLILSVTMLRTGSRGPFLAIGAALLTILIASRLLQGRRGRALLASCLVVGASAYWILNSFRDDGTERILAFVAGDPDASVAARSYLWSEALSAIPLEPYGLGLGGYAELPGIRLTPFHYPHSLPLEVAVEAGWIAAIILLLYMFFALRGSVLASASSSGSAILALLIFALVNSLVSGDINSNRLIWVMASIGVINYTTCRPSRMTTSHTRIDHPVRAS